MKEELDTTIAERDDALVERDDLLDRLRDLREPLVRTGPGPGYYKDTNFKLGNPKWIECALAISCIAIGFASGAIIY